MLKRLLPQWRLMMKHMRKLSGPQNVQFRSYLSEEMVSFWSHLHLEQPDIEDIPDFEGLKQKVSIQLFFALQQIGWICCAFEVTVENAFYHFWSISVLILKEKHDWRAGL